MPAYFFEELVHLTGEEFDQKFKSMQSMYKTEQGDPVERLREMAAETSDEAPSTILSGACLLYTSPSPRDRTRSRMPSSA